MSEIALNDAISMTTEWRQLTASFAVNGYQLNTLLPNAYTIDRNDLDQLFQNKSCQNIRIYFGLSCPGDKPVPGPDGTFPMKIIMVGVDAGGKDIYSTETPTGVYDHYSPCPSNCDSASPLCS